MQTLYYTTGSVIRRRDNVVDLAQYRRRLARAAGEREEAQGPCALPDAPVPRRPRRSRAGGKSSLALFLDACASMGVVVMTLTFTLWVLAL